MLSTKHAPILLDRKEAEQRLRAEVDHDQRQQVPQVEHVDDESTILMRDWTPPPNYFLFRPLFPKLDVWMSSITA